MELDYDDVVGQALRGYVRRVSAEIGLTGECSCVQSEPRATAYLALDGRLPGIPDRDVALLWDERHGWAAAIETHSGEDLIIQARFGPDLVPSPRAVARWVEGLFRGEVPRRGAAVDGRDPAGEPAARLARYAVAELVPVPRVGSV
ncbi:DUF6292 family protein [Actinosynnema sp. NPDC059335]|uniref:DUF6292 family protein n=1 Tax=Actinosynnema sp. NPDC059335 TaxID=3346804 RepID=UPI00366F1B23